MNYDLCSTNIEELLNSNGKLWIGKMEMDSIVYDPRWTLVIQARERINSFDIFCQRSKD